MDLSQSPTSPKIRGDKYQTPKWVFPKIVVPPNHPFLIGFSIINHPFWGTTIFGNTQICVKPGVTFSVRTLPGFLGWKFQAALQLRAVENDAIPQLQAPIVEMAIKLLDLVDLRDNHGESASIRTNL